MSSSSFDIPPALMWGGVAVAALFIFKDQIGGIFKGAQGITQGTGTAFQGTGQAISDITQGTAQAVNTITERTSEIVREVTSPTMIIQSGSELIQQQIDDLKARQKAADDARLLAQNEVGTNQGRGDIVRSEGSLIRTEITETAKTNLLTGAVQTGANILCSLPVVKDTSICKTNTPITAPPIAPTTKSISSTAIMQAAGFKPATTTANLKGSSQLKTTSTVNNTVATSQATAKVGQWYTAPSGLSYIKR